MPTQKSRPLRKDLNVAVKVNLSRMGRARNEFSKLNLEFSRTSMGKRLLKEAKEFEPFMNAKHFREQTASPERFKKKYLGAMMDYYNRLLFFAKRKGASGAVISYLGLHVRELEKEYEKFAEME